MQPNGCEFFVLEHAEISEPIGREVNAAIRKSVKYDNYNMAACLIIIMIAVVVVVLVLDVVKLIAVVASLCHFCFDVRAM